MSSPPFVPSIDCRYAGALIRTVRKRKGIPQGEFAAAVGVSPGTLQRWEIGDDPMPPQYRSAVLERLGLREDHFTLPCPSKAAERDEARTRAYHRAPARIRREIDRLLRFSEGGVGQGPAVRLEPAREAA